MENLNQGYPRGLPDAYVDIFYNSPLPQWIYDLETLAFLLVNNAAVDLYGYSREEFLNMTIREIRPPEEIQDLQTILELEVKQGFFSQSTVRYKTKSGELLYVSVKGNSIQLDGKESRLVAVIDQSDQYRAELALAASEQRFKMLVQDGSDLITIFDSEGVYNYASPTSLQVLGVPPEMLIGKNVFDFVHPEDRETAKLQFKLVESERQLKMPPFRYRHFNGEIRWMETIITNRMHDPIINGIITNSRDVTVRINEEMEKKRHIAEIELQNKKLKEISWMQSHTVRAPLATLMGLISLVDHSSKDHELLHEMLPMLKKSAEDLDTVVRSISSKTYL
jgi:PAS domain S-box-containing protein